MVRKFDFLVIGSGLAGMSFALKVAHKETKPSFVRQVWKRQTLILHKEVFASVTNLAVENFEKHIEDTMIAGDWISDREAVEKVVPMPPNKSRSLSNGE